MIADPDGSGTIANYQMVAIATSRDRTLQAGKLLLHRPERQRGELDGRAT